MTTDAGRDSTADRLVEVESQLMLLQHDVSILNDTVLQQQRQIQALQRELERLASELHGGDEPEQRDPLAERPPHY